MSCFLLVIKPNSYASERILQRRGIILSVTKNPTKLSRALIRIEMERAQKSKFHFVVLARIKHFFFNFTQKKKNELLVKMQNNICGYRLEIQLCVLD